ncbi:MAG: UDP-N-acetylmuramoyl-L-alanyl-D-glutamate--2,6-diaminopimelate ligase [Gammaproteobacteria bacterium]|jgi:UDP-N-acetylmuramoyl-L-alanyl-D-glutamate--2,6-diaminopimelate ligase
MMAAEAHDSGMPLCLLLEGLVSDRAGVAVPDLAVTGLASDSREVRPGDLFLACQGLRVHALTHAAQAVQRGAAAILWEPPVADELQGQAERLPVAALPVEGLGHKLGRIADRFFGHPSRDMHVIGVTGTDGKTSVTHFIAQALSRDGQDCGLLGTLGYGVYGRLRAPTHTTPDPVQLQAEFARLHDAGVRRVAMEVSSHALHQRRTDGTAFNTAVLTHLSRDHLDYHGSIEAYAEAKRRLFVGDGLETAVVNMGDAFGRSLPERLDAKLRVIAYGRRGDQNVRAVAHWIELAGVTARPRGIRLTLDSSWGPAEFEAPLLGAFNADNLMAALGALLAAGLTLDEAADRLRHVGTVAGRMELFVTDGGPRVVVDYAHTPHALATALQALRPHCQGELVCLFGAGGDRDAGKRPQMGAVAERHADRVVVTSDNPRSESPEHIIDQIVAGFEQPQRARRMADRGQAIEQAVAAASPDDVVLVAGKGHEEYQEIAGQRLAFSDRERVRQALQRWAP